MTGGASVKTGQPAANPAGEHQRVENSGVKNLESELVDIDADALREAERVFAQGILDTMPGKAVAFATYEETRVVVTMTDGTEYYFYGFLGESGL